MNNVDPNITDQRRRNRNRVLLLAIFAMFFGSMLVAGVLRFSGWRPGGTKNKGELLEPPADLRAAGPEAARRRRRTAGIRLRAPGALRWRRRPTAARECTEARAQRRHRVGTAGPRSRPRRRAVAVRGDAVRAAGGRAAPGQRCGCCRPMRRCARNCRASTSHLRRRSWRAGLCDRPERLRDSALRCRLRSGRPARRPGQAAEVEVRHDRA